MLWLGACLDVSFILEVLFDVQWVIYIGNRIRHPMNMLEQVTTRLAAAMKNKQFDDMRIAEVLVTTANAKLAALQTQSIENNKNLNGLRKKKKK